MRTSFVRPRPGGKRSRAGRRGRGAVRRQREG